MLLQVKASEKQTRLHTTKLMFLPFFCEGDTGFNQKNSISVDNKPIQTHKSHILDGLSWSLSPWQQTTTNHYLSHSASTANNPMISDHMNFEETLTHCPYLVIRVISQIISNKEYSEVLKDLSANSSKEGLQEKPSLRIRIVSSSPLYRSWRSTTKRIRETKRNRPLWHQFCSFAGRN